MPAYNAGKFINQAIESILNQTYSNIELLIADDKSTDNTRQLIDSYKDDRIRTFHNEKNLGYLKTCNKLFEQAQGNYITFQDADDYSLSERLMLLLDEFKKDPGLQMAGSGFFRKDIRGVMSQGDNKAYSYKEILDLMPDKLPFAWAVFMFTREVYKKHGGYHEFFDRIGEEDYYWGGKIILDSKTISIADALYCYTINPSSVSKSAINVRKLYSAKLAKFLLKQNIETGTDSLQSENMRPLRIYELECRMESYFWIHKKLKALQETLKLILLNPLKSISYIRLSMAYFKKPSEAVV